MTHEFHPTILREYDIRGVVDETLRSSDAYAIGRGFGTRVIRLGGSKVVVGYDGRLSSRMLEEALVAGLNDAGIHVIRIGLGPTPMLYYAEAVLDVDGGIQVTGSHNPANHNGFKLVLRHAPFFGEAILSLGELAADNDWTEGTAGSEDLDIMDQYAHRLVEGFRGKAFRIGWDAGNGATGPVVEKLVSLLPGEHHLLFTDVDGTFPNHHPDPSEEGNLSHLRALVAEKRLDFGIAFDGDGDRIGVIDGKGQTIWGDQLLAVFAEPVLKALPGATIIADVKCSQTLFDRIRLLGGKPLMWKSGHSHIKSKMRETGSPLAGELTGHIFFKHDYYGFDDALYAAVRLIDAVSRLERSVTELREAMPEMTSTPEMRFQVDESRKFAIIHEVLDRLAANGVQVDSTDGARVCSPDGWWLLRASNTQDFLVARAEARDRAALDRLVAQLDEQLALSGVARVPKAGD